jgi:DNA modification methylase
MTVRIMVGDVRERLAELPDASVQCVVTSPPYYGLRDYGVPGQIGLEPTLAGYIDTMVQVFREVRRVLRADGTLWLNVGDSYASSWPCSRRSTIGAGSLPNGKREARPPRLSDGLKEKDLMMVPARVALALQDDGWYLRSDIIWHKPNPMPESVRDRPTSAHEHIFLLTKQSRYFYDADAIRTDPVAPTTKMPDGWDTGPGAHGTIHRNGREKGRSAGQSGGAYAPPGQTPHGNARTDKQRGHNRRHAGFDERWDAMTKDEQQALGANARNVWTIATQGYREAHFATFPPELPRRCIRAGSRAGDTVLDPFAGAGTTLLVASRLGRSAIGIELNPEYAAMAQRRIEQDAPLLAAVEMVEGMRTNA